MTSPRLCVPRAAVDELISQHRLHAVEGSITIADAANLAILEEMLRDPRTTMHAEDLQVGGWKVVAGRRSLVRHLTGSGGNRPFALRA